jgi:nucleoside-diphosphate-sugar epimerase
MSPDEVLVLGGTGLVGSHVVAELRRREYPVLAVSRRPMPPEIPGVRWWQGDLGREEDVARLPVRPFVVSTLAIWLTAGVVRTLASGGTRRLVAFSSSSVMTKADASDDGERALAAMLLAGERTVLAVAPELQATVLRPTMIYGGAGDANVERIARQLRTMRVFPLVGGGSGRRQPVHAADLGRAAVQALESPRTAGKAYVLSGGETLTVRNMVQRVGEANGVRARFLHVPLRPAALTLRCLERLPHFRKVPAGALERMTRDLVFNDDEAARDFGYAPRAFEPPRYEVRR